MYRYLIIFIFFSVQIAIAQNSFFYDISLGNRTGQEAFEHYHKEIGTVLSYKIERSKHLKQALIEQSNQTKRDSVDFLTTYWRQENGVVLPYLFGSSFGRETAAHKELKEILIKFRISPEDMKKLTRFKNGDQVHLFLNYRKVTDTVSGKIHFEYFTYNHNTTLPQPIKENNQTAPVCKGCRIPKRKNIYDLKVQQKIKACNDKKIDRLIQSNFDVKKIAQHPFFKGRQIQILTKFIINDQGDISDLNAVSLRLELEAEAIRVFNKLPKAKPATVAGKPVNVIYTKPITFIGN